MELADDNLAAGMLQVDAERGDAKPGHEYVNVRCWVIKLLHEFVPL